ncbi:MAG: hypothetical protein ACR2LX_14555 [Jatrophihabitans sp.]
MKNPFARAGSEPVGRRSDDDVTAALRRSLVDNAADAPSAEALTEQIIADVEQSPAQFGSPRGPDRPGSGRSAGVPWLAAAAVIAALVGIVVAVVAYGPHPGRQTVAQSTAVPSPVTSDAPHTTAPTTHITTAPRATGSASRAVLPSTLTNVRVVDATFTGQDSGWALASADCLLHKGRCTALLRTTDGTVWTSHPNTPFNVAGVNGCAAPCVQNIRFATADIGYAYGPAALYLTTDGAASWQRLAGGADALETLDGNVVRISDNGGCPPGCRYTVRTSGIGQTKWTTVPLPGNPGRGVDVTLARTGRTAFLQSYGNTAGGAQARSVLWTSGDDGRSWTNRGEPCPQRGGEVDGTALTSAADGSATVLCRERQTGDQFVTTSSDGGRTFHAGRGVLPGSTGANSAGATGFGAASSSTVLVARGHTYRTTNGGDAFALLGLNGGTTPGNPMYIGFASADTGHAISSDGSTIWTTHDAGNSWIPVQFG